MINEIIKGIGSVLYAEFGYEYSAKETEQDLQKPCFFIACINPTTKLFFGRKYLRQNQFCIRYRPRLEGDAEECHNTAEIMTWILGQLSIGDSVHRGTKMRYEIVEGVLHFYVNYDCFVYKVEEKQLMEAMDSAQNNVNQTKI